MDDYLSEWYETQLEEGFSEEEVRKLLSGLDFKDSEIKKILKRIEKQKKTVKKPSLKVVQEKKPSLKVIQEKKPLPAVAFLKEESKLIWSGIFVGIIFFLLLSFVLLLFLPILLGNLGLIEPPSDETPPSIQVIASQDWISYSELNFNCSDEGSQCNNSSYSFFFSENDSCPQNYSNYSFLENISRQGFLCVAAKDVDNNTGFSKPVPVKLDSAPPKTVIEKKEEWFEKNFSIKIYDADEHSGTKDCFYRVLSRGTVVRDWERRNCSSLIEVNVGKNGCHNGGPNCVVEAYCIDSVGNKGRTVKETFNLDFDEPTAKITGFNPSFSQGDYIVLNGSVQIKGSAKDQNLEKYSVNWENLNGEQKEIFSSTKNVSNGILGTFKTTSRPDGLYKIILEVIDSNGKKAYDEANVRLSNTPSSCNPGDSQVCSWLKGVCSESTRVCGSDGLWDDCDLYASDIGYQQEETSCHDEIDNDCDGLTDCDKGFEDPDCSCVTCDDECSPGTRCRGYRLQVCGECDGDSCDDWCNLMNCSKSNETGGCLCSCGNHTTLADETNVTNGCSDGMDNDCDGLIDCVDPECGCSGLEYNCSGNRLVGDLDGNGKINLQDAGIIDLIVQGNAVLDGICCADVDDNNFVTSEDADEVRLFFNKETTCFEKGYSCSYRENCTDGMDNDCDTLIDTEDPNC